MNLNVLEGIVLSGDMVNKGVIDAESKQEVVLNWGDVKIPESIIQDGKEYLVKEIANNAFSEKKITSIEMPNSITKIGISAFAKCSEIKKLVLPDRLEQIEPFAFYKCSGLTGNLVIPSSVTEIGNAAFMLTEFTSITVNKPKGSIPGESWGWYGTVTWPEPPRQPCQRERRKCPSGPTSDETETKKKEQVPGGLPLPPSEPAAPGPIRQRQGRRPPG